MATLSTITPRKVDLSIEEFVFDPRPNYPFVITAKRYRASNNPSQYSCSFDKFSDDGITLILTHCIGGHKELWEPTLDHLWSLLSENGGPRVREAWAIDWPNHGEAAVLNEKTLQWGYDQIFCWEDFARVLHLFLRGLGRGLPNHYFRGHNLVGVGHSMGAVSILLSQTLPNPPNWKSIILIEPPMVRRQDEESLRTLLVKSAELRRDLWVSKQAAFEASSRRGNLSNWDKRVLELFCEYGLRDLPASAYPDTKGGVTLKCTKAQEIACCKDRIALIRAYNYIKYACDLLPVHVIYGAIDDWVSNENRVDLIKNAAQSKLASVQKVSGAGHLVVQVAPEGLAVSVHKVLSRDYAKKTRRHSYASTMDHSALSFKSKL